MFNQLGWGEVLVIIVVGLFVFGPERLPKMAAELARGLRKVRSMADDVTRDLRAELPPEVSQMNLRDLTPRGLVQRHVLDGLGDRPTGSAAVADGSSPRRARGSLSVPADATSARPADATAAGPGAGGSGAGGSGAGGSGAVVAPSAPVHPRYDADVT